MFFYCDQERFTCSSTDGFYAIEGECTANYYACVGGVAYSQVNEILLRLNFWLTDVKLSIVIFYVDMPRDWKCFWSTT